MFKCYFLTDIFTLLISKNATTSRNYVSIDDAPVYTEHEPFCPLCFLQAQTICEQSAYSGDP